MGGGLQLLEPCQWVRPRYRGCSQHDDYIYFMTKLLKQPFIMSAYQLGWALFYQSLLD